MVRVLFAYEMLQQKIVDSTNYAFVYADVDMLPIPLQAEIETRRGDLEKFGIIMAEGTHRHERTNFLPYYENSFQIFYTNPAFLRALKTVMIDLSISEADMFSRGKGNISEKALEQYVYNLYEYVFCYHYALEGWIKIYYQFAVTINSKPEDLITGREVDLAEVERKTLPVVFNEESCVARPGTCLAPAFGCSSDVLTKGLMIMRPPEDTGTETMPAVFVPRIKVELPSSRFMGKEKALNKCAGCEKLEAHPDQFLASCICDEIYCSERCQVRDWPNHKKRCPRIVEHYDVSHDEDLHKCAGCTKLEDKQNKFPICSRCKKTYYCSTECQRKDWKDHKKICTPPQIAKKQ